MRTNPLKNLSEPWAIRKLLYLVTAIVMFVLTIFGITTVEAAESTLNNLVEVGAPLISALVIAFAGAKTNSDSDNDLSATKVDKRLKTIENALNSPNDYSPTDFRDEPVEAVVEENALKTPETSTPLPVYDGESTAKQGAGYV